jgi:aminoglycoside/choline kinase family phosphotransferase
MGEISDPAHQFLSNLGWNTAECVSITGDASLRKYFRLQRSHECAVLMDASRNLDSVSPFLQINRHLASLGFSVPVVLAQDETKGFLLLEDFGDDTFARLLDPAEAVGRPRPSAQMLYDLATDVLVKLHQTPQAVPGGLRAYDPEKMLSDVELFLEWCTPGMGEPDRESFRSAWREVLPLAHRVPTSLLLRDYHVGNLMWLPDRAGVRRAGLLDFQDAYAGPVTYDLVSLLEDARRDVPEDLRSCLVAQYLKAHPALDRNDFEISMAVLAALRHTRVMAIFERLSRQAGRHDYKRLHGPRVNRQLRRALEHPRLATLKKWMDRHAR